jgi:hypothetical protein
MSRNVRSIALTFMVFTSATAVSTAARGQSSGNTRVANAVQFLDTEKRSRFILSYMHMGGTYKDHEVIAAMKVVDKDGDPIPGQFAVKMSYTWGTAFGDNNSTAIFFFDDLGVVTDVTAKTTSILSQPFDIASATINVLGNVIIEAFGDKMQPDDRKEFQRFVNKSDAKGLLIWSLNFQMRTGL